MEDDLTAVCGAKETCAPSATRWSADGLDPVARTPLEVLGQLVDDAGVPLAARHDTAAAGHRAHEDPTGRHNCADLSRPRRGMAVS